MNYKEILSNARHKSTIEMIAQDIGDSDQKFEVLVNYFFSTEGYVQNRIIWAISHCLDQNKALITPHYAKFARFLTGERSTWVKRGITRMMSRVDLPEDEDILGEVYTKCFDLVSDPKQEIAPRAFSVIACSRIAVQIPELKEELVPLIQDIHEHSEKGLKSACKHALIRLKVS